MTGDWLVPVLMLAVLTGGMFKRLPVYDLFVEGAREGARVAVQVLPNLAAMLCAISLMQASGLMNALCRLCAPALTLLGLPVETAPLILLRPMSGSGALAMLERLLEQFGADSRVGLIASTVMGSSETIFYTVCVYMSPLKKHDAGYAIPCSILGTLAGVWIAGMVF